MKLQEEAPLRVESDGRPLVYSTLGAIFQLESLLPEDEERFEQAHSLLSAWFGAELRWSWGSPFGEVSPFEPSDFEYVSCYPRSLLVRGVGDVDVDLVGARLDALAAQHFGIALHGAEDRSLPSPYNYRFYSVVLPPTAPLAPVQQTRAALHFTVPSSWPIDDFRARTLAIAECLRIRGGAAGLTFGDWPYSNHNAGIDAVYALARRYPGYDVGMYEDSELMQRWHDQLRTVSWLTFIGPELQQKLLAAGRVFESEEPLMVTSSPSWVLLQAGDAPEAGDANRLRIPRSYQLADALVRPIRASDDLDFMNPWTATTTTAWLRRFELGYS